MNIHRRVVSYVVVVVLLASAALGYVVATSPGYHLGHNQSTFWVLAACAFVSELIPLRWLAVDNRGEVTGGWTFIMGMLLVAPPGLAIGVTAIIFALGDLRSSKPLIKLVFNVSDIVLSLSVGAMILAATGQASQLEFGHRPDLEWFPVAAVVIATVFSINTVLTCGVIGLNSGIPFRSVVRDHGADALPTDAMFLSLAPIFVIAAQRSLMLVPPLLITTVIVYRTARLSLTRRHDSTHDLLTGMANRRLFDQRLQRLMESTKRKQQSLGLVLVDLDGFKSINDSLGHQTGDVVLIEAARRLRSACRQSDFIARLGGDEFALLLPHGGQADSRAEASRILSVFDQPFEIDGIRFELRASAGVAVAPDHAADSQALLRRADEAMYAAKSSDSAVAMYRAGQTTTAIGRLGLLNDLGAAIPGGELFLEYQPQVDLRAVRTVGLEALIRWRHPVVGVIPPASFMPLAEQTELISDITEWVLRESLAQVAQWDAEGFRLNMAVNVSVRNLEASGFASLVANLVRENKVDPAQVTIEITENTMALEKARVRACLADLSDLGVTVAIDDFGTGYSSIVQLRDLPVSQIKLDRTFVGRMADNPQDAFIVRTILQLATSLKVGTVAEGVEDDLVAGMLADLGCDQAQGYLFSRPVNAAELKTWMARQERWCHMGSLASNSEINLVDRG
jgi:diguanylate cyclase (GGDEF)-like protein